MDKFRALQYLVVAAETGSFSAAARRLQVSSTAVAKLINTLERSLRAQLVDRSERGVTLTSAGAAYAQAGSLLLRDLADADEQASASSSPSPGTVVVAVQQVIAQECLTPALPRFRARHPEIQLDIRDFNVTADFEAGGIDVFIVLGWNEINTLVRSRIGAARYSVLASPEYWSRCAPPQQPSDLVRHNCLALRALDGTVMDLWTFERDGRHESVTVRGSVVATNGHRDVVIDLALVGEGVIRVPDWTSHPRVATGRLVPALTDWNSPEAPPVNIFYRPAVRRSTRVRKFIDFASTLLTDMTARTGAVPSERPQWLNQNYGRSSAAARR